MHQAEQIENAIDELEERLARYPVERYPVQHATLRFHIGVALTNAGRFDEAESALSAAVRLFDADGLPSEHAKARNALGALLRLTGRGPEAVEAFSVAVALFAETGADAEQGAARYNLGLSLRDADDLHGAADAFSEARSLFERAGTAAQSAAAARELGSTLLLTGETDAAIETLEEAVEGAERAGDQAGLGAAANALGLARLAAAQHDAAIEGFRAAVGAHPRTVRPGDHAMAKANLALAYERAGETPRARLYARQALAVPEVPGPVREQARATLDRLGREPGDLLVVLDAEEAEHHPALVREELARWVEIPEVERRAEVGAWIDGQLARERAGVELAEAWVGALLELPPEALETMIASTLRALAERDAEAQERFRAEVGMAMARFHVPQLMRLRGEFNRIAERLGEEPSWA